MPKYIDADKALEFIKETNANYHWLLSQYSASWIYDFIESQPTADVVPREDYDNLKIELDAMRGAANSYKMHYEGLAREIFKEIEKLMNSLDRRYMASRNPKQSWGVRGAMVEIAELKKKYTKGDEGE